MFNQLQKSKKPKKNYLAILKMKWSKEFINSINKQINF